uniref:Uncharacterized protein n=1 Tax=Rhizophora mucronata TaxID=61149 RepID=A0A2P2QIU8_RHIMU
MVENLNHGHCAIQLKLCYVFQMFFLQCFFSILK